MNNAPRPHPGGYPINDQTELVRTRYGTEFDARNDWWPIHGKEGVDLSTVRANVSSKIRVGLELTLRDAARKHSCSAIQQYVHSIRHFARSMFPTSPIGRWNLRDLRSYRQVLIGEFGHEDYLRHLRSMLNMWHLGGYQGVTSTLICTLNRMKLKGAETGRAVRVADPNKGPLTADESHELLQRLNDAGEAGNLSLDDFCLAYFHIISGRRPVQSANLKCMDVIQSRGPADSARASVAVQYVLGVPRAKQVGHAFRETRRGIDLNLQNFQLFKAQCDSVQAIFGDRLDGAGFALQSSDLEQLQLQLPLFPHWPSVENAVEAAAQLLQQGEHAKALKSLQANAEGNAWHATPNMQGQRVILICEALGALARDGSPININATRLRYSKGTDLTREGLPANVVAWILDHSTSRNVAIYTDTLPERAAEINAAISKSPVMQAFASAFRGNVVDAERDAIGGADPARSRLAYKAKAAATCGHLKQCGLDEGIPYVCYVCAHFQPWLDGPHEEFLADLWAERAESIAALGQESPVAKRRDILITAVQKVIYLVDVRKRELAETSRATACSDCNSTKKVA